MIIEVKNLAVRYGKKVILENVNLSIGKGERIAILGKNGSGKTTLVESISGCKKFKGQVSIDKNFKKNIRQIFQDVVYDNDLSLKDIYKYYAQLMNLTKNEINFEVFEKYDLKDQINQKYKSLSGGQKQKFKLLMTIEMKPKILIVDEVTTALDFEWRVKIIGILKTYLEDNPECIFIMVSHNFDEIHKLTNKYFLVENKNISSIPSISEYEKEWTRKNTV